MDETTVVRRIRKGDPRVYDLLIEEYGRLLWTIVAGILVGNGTQEDVEEVVSDVFIALWQKPQAYDPARSSLRAYLCVMAKGRALDRLRRLCRAPVVSLDTEQEPAGADALEQLLARQTAAEILRLLRALAEPDREILTLRLLYEVKPSLIAAKLGMPVQQVYEKIRSGKDRLATALVKEGII